jgi:hypothetical protein
MLFRETVAVHFENHTEHTNTLCEQNAEMFHVKIDGTYINNYRGEMSHWHKITITFQVGLF